MQYPFVLFCRILKPIHGGGNVRALDFDRQCLSNRNCYCDCGDNRRLLPILVINALVPAKGSFNVLRNSVGKASGVVGSQMNWYSQPHRRSPCIYFLYSI